FLRRYSFIGSQLRLLVEVDHSFFMPSTPIKKLDLADSQCPGIVPVMSPQCPPQFPGSVHASDQHCSRDVQTLSQPMSKAWPHFSHDCAQTVSAISLQCPRDGFGLNSHRLF